MMITVISNFRSRIYLFLHYKDNEDPVISGMPSDVSEDVGSASTITQSWLEPTASDNSGSYTLTSSHSSGSEFPIGVTTVSYTATDAAGNSVIESFTIEVIGKFLELIQCVN